MSKCFCRSSSHQTSPTTCPSTRLEQPSAFCAFCRIRKRKLAFFEEANLSKASNCISIGNVGPEEEASPQGRPREDRGCRPRILPSGNQQACRRKLPTSSLKLATCNISLAEPYGTACIQDVLVRYHTCVHACLCKLQAGHFPGSAGRLQTSRQMNQSERLAEVP